MNSFINYWSQCSHKATEATTKYQAIALGQQLGKGKGMGFRKEEPVGQWAFLGGWS